MRRWAAWVLAMSACACVRGPETVRPAPAWTGKEPLSWLDCAEGSTLQERRTPGDGREPWLVRLRRVHNPANHHVRISVEGPKGPTGTFRLIMDGSLWGPESVERFLRRDSLVVEGEPVAVDVFERITDLNAGNDVFPDGSRLVEEVWRQAGAPPAWGPLRVRYDPTRSVHGSSSGRPPSSLRVPDAQGFIDTRQVLRLGAEAVIDGQVHPCMEVRSWNVDDVPADSLECPSVLGGRAWWEQVHQTRNGQSEKDLLEVVSFDCRPLSRP
ncbi:hypothetical protein ATI61_104498 [Archangium gephyra]|uniref:Lipoprotein n=2 Tax=Archangium gephyra TaxID=48 RepID=A0ABX9K537_9BACT|nr:hypothetical protein ATI61_104498 [Archangium gephyra]